MPGPGPGPERTARKPSLFALISNVGVGAWPLPTFACAYIVCSCPTPPRVWSSAERQRQDKPANHDLFTTVSFVEKKTGAGKMAQW